MRGKILSAQICASRKILIDSQKVGFPYEVNVLGHLFEVQKEVFSPRFFNSTPLFTASLCSQPLGHLLEIGSGIGATAVITLLNSTATRVTAVDISPAAVANTASNLARHGVQNRSVCKVSDIFSALDRDNDRFDSIYWNMPFIYMEEAYRFKNTLEYSLCDP